MAIFNPALLSQFRALSEGEMPDTFTVDLPGDFTSDGRGGGSYAVPTDTRGPYPSRLSSKGDPKEVNIASRMEQEGLEMLTRPLGVALEPEETGTYTFGDPLNGPPFRFQVKLLVPSPSLSAHSKALIRRT